MTKIQLLEQIAKIAEDVVYEAFSLQPDQFNPDSYEVTADLIDKLTVAVSNLSEMEMFEDDYII